MSIIFIANILALLFSFFVIGAVLGALFSKSFRSKLAQFLFFKKRLALGRAVCNPILTPGMYPWNAEAVMNPAAVILSGRTHLVYRAIGMDGVSRLGYASSPDGFSFDDVPPYPAFIAQNPRKIPGPFRRYSPVMYPSGGSWGGCEDPRMVVIDDTVYVTYNAFDGWDFIRIAFTSIPESDFLAKRFYKWREPRLLSREGQRNKNWALFPEKIGGKFALLHSLHASKPDRVCIAYVDDLDTFDPEKDGFHSPYYDESPAHKAAWHEKVRGIGPPPLRTERGWLVFYHAHEKGEGHRYKLGAMLLDLDDPTKILVRAIAPALSPDLPYENEGKTGVVYACGATIVNGELRVYYGGGDKVICVATAPLDDFLNALTEGERMELAPAGRATL